MRLQKTSLLTVQNLYILTHPVKFLFDVVPDQMHVIILIWQLEPSIGVDKHSEAETFQHGCTQSEINIVRA